jgi:hypothetical protein
MVEALGPVPSEAKIRSALSTLRFQALGPEDEKGSGFVSWRCVTRDCDLDKSILGDHTAISIRVDTRKVPASLLAAEVEEAVANESNEGGFIKKERRKELKESIKKEMLPKIIPTPKTIEAGWNRRLGLVITSATGTGAWNELNEHFKRGFGIDLQKPDPGVIAARLGVHPAKIEKMEPLVFGVDKTLKDCTPATSAADADDEGTGEPTEASGESDPDIGHAFLGREFLTWLWWRWMTEGGTGGDEDPTTLMMDDMLQFGSTGGRVRDAALKKGNPSDSPAAFRALLAGMTPVKAKFRLKDADLEWVFTINASTLDLCGMKLPPVDAHSQAEIGMLRLDLMAQAINLIEDRFKQFLNARIEDPEGMRESIAAWAADRLSELVG